MEHTVKGKLEWVMTNKIIYVMSVVRKTKGKNGTQMMIKKFLLRKTEYIMTNFKETVNL